MALKKFDFLHWFEGIVVSEKKWPENPFQTFIKLRLSVLFKPEELFIDDNKRNIEAAKALGIQSIHLAPPTTWKRMKQRSYEFKNLSQSAL